MAGRGGARPHANPVLGISRLCVVGQAAVTGQKGCHYSGIAADRHTRRLASRLARICYIVRNQAGVREMNSPPERLDGTVDPKLLEILVCPMTKGPLEFDATRQELISRSAKLAYPIRDGIPIMLPEEARKID